MHQSILVFNGFRYFKISMLLMLIAILAYGFHAPVDGPNGGTWLGYTLGGIAAALILWLMWFGIRKRDYKSDTGTVQGWLSAHVYLGLALIVITTLHAGFQIAWNIHTLAYTLMLFVIGSGMFGVYVYLRFPQLMTENRRSHSMITMLSGIADLDRECRELAATLSDEINRLVIAASNETAVGGNVRQQLFNSNKRSTTQVIKKIEVLSKQLPIEQNDACRKLLTLLGKKVELANRARNDVKYKAMLDIWLYFHVPLSFALLAALIAHIVSVFFYW